MSKNDRDYVIPNRRVIITGSPGGTGIAIGGGGGGGSWDPPSLNDAAYAFLRSCGLDPTPDAVGQLTEVFLPCLRIMCERPWDPNGATWRKSGIFGALTDAKKKWERFWERTWPHGKRHDDSGFDLINYIGFVMRSDPDSRWAEWGEPGNKEEQ